jgi:hypothetical protein
VSGFPAQEVAYWQIVGVLGPVSPE